MTTESATYLNNEIYDNMGVNQKKGSNAFTEGALHGLKI
jgi:hypothetical protein